MTNIVYYAVDKVNESLTSTALPKNLQKHAYKAESISVWYLLIEKYKQVFNSDLPSVEFLKSGKPIIENGYVSLSHGDGVVAVCFSKTVEVYNDFYTSYDARNPVSALLTFTTEYDADFITFANGLTSTQTLNSDINKVNDR